MKKLFLTVMAFVTVGAAVVAQNKAVKASESKVVWKGYKVAGSHEGTINMVAGNLEFKNDVLKGGAFEIDMASIETTDLSGEYKDKLDGHLKSDDFFGVTKYPKANLVMTKVKPKGKNAYDVTGNLTIKGQTHPIQFVMSVYGSKATANLKVDRSKYDVRYGSSSFFDNLQDKVIYDEFDIIADLQF
ncbi:YceI family protein [Bizionia sediminis]|uniref:YceI family protein n=1 Tax=Bizionia sediminis TaxID=1737064 RepID=A0ABW5KTU9_9FLAO